MAHPATMVGLGELLWDLFPSGKQLGGAPANFAYMSSLLGNQAVVASRIGRDPLGQEAIARLEESGIITSFVQQDTDYPTGTVLVSLDHDGQPEYTIPEPVAWDFLQWSDAWAELAARADVICFGTLAQRSTQSRETIQRVLRAAAERTLRVCDVNLRQAFYSAEVLRTSLEHSHIAKLNHEELPVVADLLGIAPGNEEARARQLRETFDLRLLCVTRGANGSLLVSDCEAVEHDGVAVKVVDTVGAGDAFTACLAHEFLRGSSLDQIGERANRFAAWAASQAGGMPRMESLGHWPIQSL